MISFQNSRKIIYCYLFLILLNIKLSSQIIIFNMSIPSNETELPIFHIKSENFYKCNKIIPSLLSPILLIDEVYKDENPEPIIQGKFPIDNKFMEIKLCLHNYTILNKYFVVMANEKYGENLKNCYLGLSSRNWTKLEESQILLNRLKGNQETFSKIFSFNKWFIDEVGQLIKTDLIIGNETEHFKNKEENGIIGECEVEKDNYYWACSFNQMSFNNNIANLKKENGNGYYKIYFSSEENIIRFPISFNKTFQNITHNKCRNTSESEESEGYFLTCEDFFNNKGYSELKLISDNMNITIQIDNKERFTSENNNGNSKKSRIRFEKDFDDFFLPLIMFKEFDIQFDAENDKIKFYTTNKEILQVKKKKEKEKESSNAGIVILIIFIIILILALGFGLFWFKKKRKGSVEKNINKYNKFDEDENFKNLNEQRVF